MRTKHLVLMLTIPLVLISVWFGPGKMLGHADDGIPFYNPQRTAEKYVSYFYDSGLGVNGTFNLPRMPLFWSIAWLQKIGISPIAIQKIVYFVLLATPLLTIPKLITEVYGSKNSRVGMSAAIFYVFNLYSYSQIWTRFVLSLTFLWSYLPLFLLLWIRLVRTHKARYAIYLIGSSLFFSTAFVIISPLLTLWVCAAIYLGVHLINSHSRGKDLSVSLLVAVLWAISNTWWIYPMWHQRHSVHGASIDASANIVSLTQVSKFFPSSEIFTLRQKFMLGPLRPNYDFYNRSSIRIMSWLIFALVIVGLLTSKKSPGKLFFGSILVVGWFISKGTNPPFGLEVFTFLFDKFPVLQIYRNSYEKFGLVWLLAYSVFFGFGLKIIPKFAVSIVLFVACGYLLKPFWTPNTINDLAGIKVPDSYENANQLIQSQNSTNNRILQLPLLRGQYIAYKWNYKGEEVSEFLFDAPSVSKTLTNKIVDEIYLKLGEPDFFRNNPNFTNILATMDIGFIVVHDDVIQGTYYQENPSETREHVKHWSEVSYVKKFEDLEIYKINPQKVPGRLYVISQLTEVEDLDSAFATIATPSFDPTKEAVIVKTQNTSISSFFPQFAYPVHKVRAINSHSYEVSISDASQPFVLVLANNFDESWQARIQGQPIPKKIIINGFANGWIVDKPGTYNIDVDYTVWPWEDN